MEKEQMAGSDTVSRIKAGINGWFDKVGDKTLGELIGNNEFR
jgi:hypothetical protein